MRRKTFLVCLTLLLIMATALPAQAAGSTVCNQVQYLDSGYKVYCKVTVSPIAANTKNIVAKYTDYSTKVYEIENMLSKLGYNVVVSKFFDYRTLLEVQKFQIANNLPPTGTVDQATYEKLKEKYNDTVNSTVPGTPAENPGNSGNADAGNNGASDVSGLTAEEQKMINLVNQERTSRGLPALKVDMALVKTARMKSQDMIKNNYFAHQSPTYGSPFDLMKSQGISYKYAGENLAGASSVENAHRNLMNSSGHRQNILNPNFTHIGIGIVHGGPYGMMITQHFVGR